MASAKSDVRNSKTKTGFIKIKSSSSQSMASASANSLANGMSNLTLQQGKEIDLTKPEEVLQALELADLTDEETDILLQEAYEINRRLKKQLALQEQGDSSLGPMSRSETLIPAAGKRTVLPPLHHSPLTSQRKSSSSSSRSSSSYPRTSAHTKPSSSAAGTRAKGVPLSGNKAASATSQRPGKSAKPKSKAEWDDRFSYK